MRSRTFAILAGLTALAPVAATAQHEHLSDRDRAMMVADLEGSRDRFIAATRGLSDAQWRFKPAPERWSIMEVAEHLAIADRELGGLVRGGLQPARPAPADSVAARDRFLRTFLSDRSQRFQAPEGFRPSGQWATPEALVEAWRGYRAGLLEFVRTTHDALRTKAAEHPAGTFDGVQWVILISAHMDRHIQQIEEVKKAPGYPGM